MPPSNFSCVVRLLCRPSPAWHRPSHVAAKQRARWLAGDRLCATPVATSSAYGLLGCGLLFGLGLHPTAGGTCAACAPHCVNMVVVVVGVVVRGIAVPRACLFSLCLVSQLLGSWYQQYFWRPARLLSRGCPSY